MAARDGSIPDQLRTCTRLCGARCCRYVTTGIPPPLSRADWDEVRWWLAHEGTMVTKDEDGWTLHVETRCRHLAPDRTCRVYEGRMDVCSRHDAAACEYPDPRDDAYEVLLRSEADLAAHLERRGLVRGREVVRRIRAAQRLRRAPPYHRP